MFTNWLTYRAVAEELDRRIRGWQIGTVYSQDKSELIIEVSDGSEELAIHFSSRPQSASLLLREDFKRAKKNTVNLFQKARSKTLQSVQIIQGDRIIRLLLDDGSIILALLYGAKANLLYFNELGRLDNSFKRTDSSAVSSDYNADDTVSVPSQKALADLVEAIPEKNIKGVLKALQPWLAGTIAEEICRRAGIPETMLAKEIDSEQQEKLHAAIGNVLDEACEPSYYIYNEQGVATAFSLIRLSDKELEEMPFDDIFEALFTFYKRSSQVKRIDSVKQQIMKTIERELQRAQRALSKSADEKVLIENADEYEKFGNLLMLNIERQPEQPGQMSVPDLFTDPRLIVSIPLRERLSVIENAQRYYDKAKNTRASIIYVNERKAEMQAKVERLTWAKGIFNAIADYGELRDIMAKEKELMNELGFTKKGEKAEVFPFRRFVVAGGFEVWAGKSSENNDLLTVRNSKPNDLWFHARGVGGSHVVIKVDSAPGKPGKDTIREAAAIAAYYSKHRKSNSVPVAYTEKKYVNKPRGVPAGTVTLQREKVIMVRPGLPADSKEEE
jgi:predicted ribosome quality control (RQC) complex YloA/Tae2 family protein